MRIHSMIAATAALMTGALIVGALPATAAGSSAATAVTNRAAAETFSIPPWASYVASLPPYQPSRQVSGTVTSCSTSDGDRPRHSV